MKKKVLAAMIIAMGMLTACGEDELPSVIQTVEPEPIVQESEEVPGDTQTEDEEAVVVPADTAVIGEREVVDGKMQSYLTGEWKDEAVVNRRSIAVMMPNNKKSLPQYGISQASIIYEAPVEGRVSRLMAIYEDYDDLDRIGPVRSSRDYYIYEAMSYDSIYVNWGLAVPYVADLINSNRVDNISQAVSGIEKPAGEVFDRVDRAGYATEYTGYLFPDKLAGAIDRLGYETEYRDTFEQAFTFANDGHRAEYANYPDATEIYPGGTDSNSSGYGDANPCFSYNAEDGLYYRSQYGGSQIDEMNGEQLAVSNVILKVCTGAVRDANDYLMFNIHGEGTAYIFTNGKVIEGTWKHMGDNGANMFYDENGNEIVFNQGKTWVCEIWKDYEDCVSYK
uniref:DUF3048 domain-containing protein n=1 Tax=Acetatifactor sp. TaxID=1872090 RepID=UPI0040576B6E